MTRDEIDSFDIQQTQELNNSIFIINNDKQITAMQLTSSHPYDLRSLPSFPISCFSIQSAFFTFALSSSFFPLQTLVLFFSSRGLTATYLNFAFPVLGTYRTCDFLDINIFQLTLTQTSRFCYRTIQRDQVSCDDSSTLYILACVYR